MSAKRFRAYGSSITFTHTLTHLLNEKIITLYDHFSCASPFRRRIAEEGHGDPSNCAFGIYYEHIMHI
jgi:hypothetical protein